MQSKQVKLKDGQIMDFPLDADIEMDGQFVIIKYAEDNRLRTMTIAGDQVVYVKD